MAKDKETKEQSPAPDVGSAPPVASPPAAPAASQPDVGHIPPAPVPEPPKRRRDEPTAHDITVAIKTFGAAFTQPQRDEIIRTVASLPPPATEHKPSPYDGQTQFRFAVSWSHYTAEITALNEIDARANFNDSIKQYPSPKAVKVQCLGPVKAEAAVPAAS